jgi:rfaE bifunctional protein nucleotidyltransferase chain/domain/rfaE bifunctional protein kinase chain/domain
MRGRRGITVVGDVVLDHDVEGAVDRVCPDAPVPVVDVARELEAPGAAGLAAVLCRAGHDDVALVAPVAEDPAGRRLVAALEDLGVTVFPLGHRGPTRVKTRVRAEGQSLLRLDTGGPATPEGDIPAAVRDRIAASSTVLVSDYGAGTAAHPGLRELLGAMLSGPRILWDPHPRGPRPVNGAALVTPNLAEAGAALSGAALPGADQPGTAAARLRERWSAAAVAVTCGSAGAWLSSGAEAPLFVPAPVACVGDSCGAGDQFVASAAVAMTHGALPSEAVIEAVAAASQWVASGGAASFHQDRARLSRGPASSDAVADAGADARAVVARARALGGTVVATGGCFDLLHAGHVASLSAARALGDCLVVLLNSDDSVRRIKGPGRPVHTAADRAAVLTSLRAVDAVVLFDEDDPTRALRELRPDVWAKGGDHDVDTRPEATVVRTWGGRVVSLPYLDGHGTTQILDAIT